MEKIFATILVMCIVAAARSQTDAYTKYKFHFKTGDTGEHTRAEESNATGHVSGMYSYLDPNGILRVVRYSAAPGIGYQAFGEGIPQIGSASLEEHKPDTRSLPKFKSEPETSKENISIVPQVKDNEISNAEGSPTQDLLSSASVFQNSTTTESNVPESSTEPSSMSSVDHSKILPILFPFGAYRSLLVPSRSVLYTIPHALTYNMIAPSYPFVL
ncbi:uncharacterized protein CDAR_454451 [Caerostris darwini]|uniref:Cuticle protein 6 n=1 Tax=Caerostris darwini TaxID=1538125 RepID=A0AAV4V806_9ARAC|nr:uncharacterized protein CDAR_454451 [Caerostris darwini]